MRFFFFPLLLSLILVTPAFAHEESTTTTHYDNDAWGTLVLRIHNASHGLSDIANRIDTRATIIAQANINSPDVRASLEEARYLLLTADKQLAEATTSNVGLREMSTSLRETVALLQKAKASLNESISILRNATVGDTTHTTESIDVSAPEVQ